ncbi:unnamed protein product [Cyclocybe aegerita]|uniref:Uncharacterized protein n=1 Tax=Cyclocybe aegerita TaxID=1973307 RepID=A0A8S0WMA8_CYCAE|nr:unnamed protein product [Cyclocybe aegerita]
MADPELPVPSDPKVSQLTNCPVPGCLGLMGVLRVYKGAGDLSKCNKRGSIVQTCQLLLHLLNPQLPPERTTRFLRSPSPVTVLYQPTWTGRIDCANEGCTTKGGVRMQGSRTCIEYKCKTCCIVAFQHTRENGTSCAKCNAHSQPAVTEQVVAPPTPEPTQISVPMGTSATPPTPAPTACGGPAALRASTQSNRTPSKPSSQAPVRTQRAPVLPPQGSQISIRQTLAQPLNSDWAKSYESTLDDKIKIKSLKAQQQEMGDRQCRTCTLVIYYKNGEPPLRLTHFVKTFPNLQLSSVSSLVKEANLTVNSKINYYQGGWAIISINDVLDIEKIKELVLQLHPSLFEPLNNCPGLEQELAHQPS